MTTFRASTSGFRSGQERTEHIEDRPAARVERELQGDGTTLERHYGPDGRLIQKITRPAPGTKVRIAPAGRPMRINDVRAMKHRTPAQVAKAARRHERQHLLAMQRREKRLLRERNGTAAEMTALVATHEAEQRQLKAEQRGTPGQRGSTANR